MKTRHEHIAEIAYFLWLNRGKPMGKDVEIWYEAEQIYNITSSGFKSKDLSKPAVKKAKKTDAKKVVKTKAAAVKKDVKAEEKKDVVEAKKTSIKVNLKPAEKKTTAKKTAKKVPVAKIIPILKPKIALSRGITQKSIKVVVKKS